MLTRQRRDGPGKREGVRRWARNNKEFPSKLRSSIRQKGNSRPPRGKEGPLKMRGLVLSWNAEKSQSRAVWMRGQWMVGWPPERLLQRLWSPSTHSLALCGWFLSLDIPFFLLILQSMRSTNPVGASLKIYHALLLTSSSLSGPCR